MKLLKKPLKLITIADIFAIIGTFFLTAAHAITQAAIWALATPSAVGAEVEAVARAFEANQLAVSLLASVSGISLMIQYVIFPALVLTYYYIMRRAYIKRYPSVLIFVGIFLFFLGFLNVLNDLGNYIGVLIATGKL